MRSIIDSVTDWGSDGVTDSERYLFRLACGSFISFWTFSGIYRDQGRQSGKGDGKELCDLIIVFGDHIILFSDKECQFPKSGNAQTDWSRWSRRAIRKSAEQLWGAERWIRDLPEKLYLDRNCTIPFPIDIPHSDRMKVHRVIVARGAAESCRVRYGGSGSLMLFGPQAERELKRQGRDLPLFAVGDLDESRGFVHVFDEVTLPIVLRTLDTLPDFVSYLEKKEDFVRSGMFLSASGEEELLAYYLQSWNREGELNFHPPSALGIASDSTPRSIVLGEGGWEELNSTELWRTFTAWNEISYFWDELIQKFANHTIQGTLYRATDPSPRDQETLLRMLAAEPRHRRQLLATALLGQLQRAPTDAELDRSSRVVFSTIAEQPTYVFLITGKYDTESTAAYRDRRRILLQQYCIVAKHLQPYCNHFIAIGVDAKDVVERCEDIVYLDASHWTAEMEEDAIRLHNKCDILKNVRRSEFRRQPRHYLDAKAQVELADLIQRSKVGRNERCPCGSGLKFKKCHGQS
jgi:SEC-C motif-containing protein